MEEINYILFVTVLEQCDKKNKFFILYFLEMTETVFVVKTEEVECNDFISSSM